MIILLPLVEELQCHNKWKLISVYNGNTSAIISLKAEDKLKIMRWKIKKHSQKICDIEMLSYVSEWIFLPSVLNQMLKK